MLDLTSLRMTKRWLKNRISTILRSMVLLTLSITSFFLSKQSNFIKQNRCLQFWRGESIAMMQKRAPHPLSVFVKTLLHGLLLLINFPSKVNHKIDPKSSFTYLTVSSLLVSTIRSKTMTQWSLQEQKKKPTRDSPS